MADGGPRRRNGRGARPALGLFGASAPPSTQLFFRAFGVSLFFVALVHHATRASRDVTLIRSIAIANIVEDGILMILSIGALASGTFGPTGVLLVAMFGAEVALNVWLARLFSRG